VTIRADASSEHPPSGARRSGSSWAGPGVLLAIAAGGALGAPARYGLAELVDVAPGSFPWATFWTNVSGSLALGFVLVVLVARFPPTRYLRPFVAVGFLGAFTTFSTFAVETDLLVKDGHLAVGIAYATASVAAGLAAAWAGMVLARMSPLGPARPRRAA